MGAEEVSQSVAPFLRWVGSKRRLLPQLAPHLPNAFGTYHEPFLGAGSLFLSLSPSTARIGDTCSPLIDTWRAVASDPEAVFAAATKWSLDEATFYAVRALRLSDPIELAGRFIYLNRGAFNGLYRENLRGEFNVPWGRPKTDTIVDLEVLRAAAGAIAKPGVESGLRLRRIARPLRCGRLCIL